MKVNIPKVIKSRSMGYFSKLLQFHLTQAMCRWFDLQSEWEVDVLGISGPVMAVAYLDSILRSWHIGEEGHCKAKQRAVYIGQINLNFTLKDACEESKQNQHRHTIKRATTKNSNTTNKLGWYAEGAKLR